MSKYGVVEVNNFTPEENKELVETLKGPRFYRVQLWGYGGESAYFNVSKAAHDFWKPILDEHGDNDLVEYMISDEADECDFENIESVPTEADFLTEQEDGRPYKYPWYEGPNEIVHQYGVEYNSARITVEEISTGDYTADIIGEVIGGEELQEYLDGVMEANDYEIELVESDEDFGNEGDYTLQMTSSEKGTFFNGRIETIGNFDPKKLKVICTEYPNGEDTVTSILYDGVDVENDGAETNGKGYYAAVWSNK
tara:strand:- start:163 stop:921 length:759 start_codon:yes stop_codon:yes gene_type:complete